MSNSYKLAVIIPCWNCEKEITQMLNCILQQTFQDWHVFCIDDQSQDNTLQILKEYSNLDGRINYKVRDREPKGAQTCRNIGFNFSEGAEYVIWFDSDDMISPYCFEQRVSYMDKHPELDFGVFPAKTFSKDISETKGINVFGYPFFEDSLKAMLSWTLPMVGWTNIYKRSSLIKYHHNWDERILSLQDSDFNLQSILKGMKYDFAYKENAKIDYFYRVIEKTSSISKKIKTKEHYNSHLYLFSKTMNSISAKDERIYYKYMKINSLLFANILKNDRECYNSFLSSPWFRKHKMLKLRYQIWQLFHFRLGRRFFLKGIYKDLIEMRKIWGISKKQIIKDIDTCTFVI